MISVSHSLSLSLISPLPPPLSLFPPPLSLLPPLPTLSLSLFDFISNFTTTRSFKTIHMIRGTFKNSPSFSGASRRASAGSPPN